MSDPPKSSLFTPDPYYIPGYEGFYPQIRYQIGETYGKTTSRLLTDPSVRKSPCSVLAPLGKPRFIEDFSGTNHPSTQMLDQNYSYFPGYSVNFSPLKMMGALNQQPPPESPTCGGHLPPGQESQLRDRCRLPVAGGCVGLPPPPCNAGRRVRCSPHRSPYYAGTLWLCTWPSGNTLNPHPLFSVRIEGVPLPAMTETVDVSRYNILPKLDAPNLIQRKAISAKGYTGFVPRFTWIMGVNYLQGVNDAMNEFDRNQSMLRNPVWNFGKRLPQTYWPNNKIYTSAGLMPFYTGFVPS
uniref:Ciliary microtubule inner protein 2A n=1 Tax=Pelodiscus sinensis TaxID=13735 RepID=K7F9S2_PELSI